MNRLPPLAAALIALALAVLPAGPAAAQGVSWWLGSSGETGSAPVEANQTLGWWLGSSAQAQNDDGTAAPPEGEAPDYAAWEQVATAAEEVIAAPGSPNVTLERTRIQIAAWRERFLTAQNANRARVETVRDQIAALGPAPAEGAEEAPEIAARRAALNQQLAERQAPGLAAEEAYRRADGLIREIDAILRDRQTSALLELGPSPLVPVNWPPAIAVLADLGADLWREAQNGWASVTSRAGARENLPFTLMFLGVAAVLLAGGRRWSDRRAERVMAGSAPRAKRVVLALLVSLGQVVLPVVGLVLLVRAAGYSGLVGPRGQILLDAVPLWGFVMLSARWLGQQVFAGDEGAAHLKGLAPERRAEGRLYSTLLGVLLALAGLLTAMIPFSGDTLTARAVLGFPLQLLGGLILVRMGQILAQAGQAAITAAEAGPRGRILLIIGRAALAFGIFGPLLAALGYYTAGRFLVFPTALSLALLAFLAVLQRLTSDLYALATRRDDDAEEALVPVLIGFALVLLALPLLALIWGARISDLTELWTRAREGFAIGDTRIAPADFVTFAIIFSLGYLATRLVQGTLRTSVLPKTRLDVGGRTAIVSGTGYVGIVLAAAIAITSAGIDLSNLAIIAGALGVGIGFGLQNIVSNFISGIILLIERPISEGDWIDVGGQSGIVRNISVRSTRIETFDRSDVIVPNSALITGMVTNFTRGNLMGRIIVKVSVAYGNDTRRVEGLLRDIVEAHPLVALTPQPGVFLVGLGAESLDFEIRAILRDVNFAQGVKSDLNHEIVRRFDDERIDIPFWMKFPAAEPGRGHRAPPAQEDAGAPADQETGN